MLFASSSRPDAAGLSRGNVLATDSQSYIPCLRSHLLEQSNLLQQPLQQLRCLSQLRTATQVPYSYECKVATLVCCFPDIYSSRHY